jgi:hypothetical protein
MNDLKDLVMRQARRRGIHSRIEVIIKNGTVLNMLSSHSPLLVELKNIENIKNAYLVAQKP